MSTSFTTSKLGLDRPIALASAVSVATSVGLNQIIVADTDAVDLAIGDDCRLYTSAFVTKSLSGGATFVTITDISAPSVGQITITFTPDASANTAAGDFLCKIEVTDVTRAISNQMDKIDSKFDCVVCTSSTRPGSPFLGQLIYETDTTIIHIWDGTIWRTIRPTNDGRPRGFKGFATTTVASASVSGTTTELATPYLTITCNIVEGNFLRFIVETLVDSASSDFAGKRITIRRKKGLDPPSNTDTLIRSRVVHRQDNATLRANTSYFFDVWKVPTGADNTGTWTFGVFLRSESGASAINFAASHMHAFAIEDLGSF